MERIYESAVDIFSQIEAAEAIFLLLSAAVATILLVESLTTAAALTF